jgi:hypothetical protein
VAPRLGSKLRRPFGRDEDRHKQEEVVMAVRTRGRPFSKLTIDLASTDAATDVTENKLTGITMAGRALGVSSLVIYEAWGTIGSKSGASCNMVWKVYLGTSAILTLTKTGLTASLSGLSWYLRAMATILTIGTTGDGTDATGRVDGFVRSQESSGTSEISIISGADIASIDITGELQATLSGQLSESDASNAFTFEQTLIEVK